MRRLGGFQRTALAVVIAMSSMAYAQAQIASETKHREVIVSLADRQLALMEEGHVLRMFAVAVGAAVSPSPEGDFQIVNRVENPTYYHPGKVIASGAQNPLGTRWMGLSKAGFAGLGLVAVIQISRGHANLGPADRAAQPDRARPLAGRALRHLHRGGLRLRHPQPDACLGVAAGLGEEGLPVRSRRL